MSGSGGHMATRKQTPPPVSRTVQRLLAQIHAEAEAATLEALSAKDGITVLQPMPKEGRHIESCGPRGFWVRGADGSELTFFIDHEPGDGRRVGPRWSANEQLIDGQGRSWGRYHGWHLITDDLGNLVDGDAAVEEVPF